MKLTFKGKEYRGADGNKGMIVFKGQTVEVSDQKAAQLFKDFPNDWQEAEGTPPTINKEELKTEESKESDSKTNAKVKVRRK